MRLKNYKSIIGEDNSQLYDETKQIFSLIFMVLVPILFFCGIGVFLVFKYSFATWFVLAGAGIGFIIGLILALAKQK